MKTSDPAKELFFEVERLEKDMQILRDTLAKERAAPRKLRGGNAILIRRDGFSKTMMMEPSLYRTYYSIIEAPRPYELSTAHITDQTWSRDVKTRKIDFELQREYDACGRAVYLEV